MIKLLTSPWFSAPLGAVLYLASMLLFWKTPQPVMPARDPSASASSGPSWEFKSPEADQLMNELKSEKGALALRKQQLDELAARLDAQRQELAAATLAVRQMQAQFDQSVVRLQEEEIPNLKKLGKVYASMTPAGAAAVMSQLDDSVNVKVLLFMKESETAAILDTMAKKGPAEAKRAAAISEHVRLSIAHKALPAK